MHVTTAKDVAREAGVHPSTVSRSLDPAQQALVRPATRARVLEVARRLDYRPDFTASSLRRQRTTTIGVVIPRFTNVIYDQLMQGITSELDAAGYVALIMESPDGADRMAAALSTLRARRVDGIICASSRKEDESTLRRFESSGTPIVLALRWVEDSNLPRVVNDDVYGGALAARHLIDLGHTRVIEIPGPTNIMTFPARSKGFFAGMDSAGLTPLEHGIETTAPSVNEGRRVMSELLDSGVGAEATAVFAHNDLLAIGAIDALVDSGRHCPKDVSVIGYNDNDLTDHLNPALSTIRMPVDEMGRLAARRVVQAIAGVADLPDEITLRPSLVARKSTARVAQ